MKIQRNALSDAACIYVCESTSTYIGIYVYIYSCIKIQRNALSDAVCICVCEGESQLFRVAYRAHAQ